MRVYFDFDSPYKFLTSGKRYTLYSPTYREDGSVTLGTIVDDEGDNIVVRIDGCAYLDWKEWSVE